MSRSLVFSVIERNLPTIVAYTSSNIGKSLDVYLLKSLLKLIPNLAYVSYTTSLNIFKTSSSISGE